MEGRQYLQTWSKYLPVIRLHLKKSVNAEQSFKLNITDFESAGDRGKSGYIFSIQIENGRVANNIGTSPVARDLFEILKNDENVKAMFAGRSIKISVGKTFLFSIKNTHISSFKEAEANI